MNAYDVYLRATTMLYEARAQAKTDPQRAKIDAQIDRVLTDVRAHWEADTVQRRECVTTNRMSDEVKP